MKTIITAVIAAVTLAGCLPMALFAGAGDPYRNYKQHLGVYVAHDRVNTFCLTPKLRLAIWEFEGHFGKRIVMNSGFRDPFYNGSVNGAENSYHMKCMAADFFIPGVPKNQLIAFARRLDVVGGLGCYPGQRFIHIDVRDRPAGRRGPITFGGC
ncbi:YcbK family protein [Arsenicitalea aurantiaca]|nr:D-Ala-D-Ala carboxypeptidase family metallohydrolase [Arsenicitalea aurantiaca]